jgi:putative transposase
MQEREQMPIVKLEVSIPELRKSLEQFAINRIKALSLISDEVRSAVSTTFDQLLKAELELFLGDSQQQDNKRNGYLPAREYVLKGVGAIRVRVPRDRKGEFQSVVVPFHEKMDPRLEADMAILHLAGLSTRTLAMISKRLLGVEVNKDSVTNSLDIIKGEAEKWLTRPLSGRYWALFIDGTNFRIQRRGSTLKEPSLVVLGVDENNRKSILAIESGTKDSADCWKTVFNELKRRGLDPKYVKVGIMDGRPGLEAVFKEEFHQAKTARCWRHALENTLNKVSKRNLDEFKSLTYGVMYAVSEEDARKAFLALKMRMEKDEYRAIKCIEKDLEPLLTHYSFSSEFWTSLRTTNSIERVNKELKRRYKSMEQIGSQNLTCFLAFTALRLEMGWATIPINARTIDNFKYTKCNTVEKTVAELKLIQ